MKITLGPITINISNKQDDALYRQFCEEMAEGMNAEARKYANSEVTADDLINQSYVRRAYEATLMITAVFS
jgi:hypothetical protein